MLVEIPFIDKISGFRIESPEVSPTALALVSLHSEMTVKKVGLTYHGAYPALGPAIITANHLTTIDGPMMLCVARRTAGRLGRAVTRDTILYPHKLERDDVLRRTGKEGDELAKGPMHLRKLRAALLRNCGAIAVRRGESDREMIRMSLDVLRNNEMLVIFLFETRNPDNDFLAARPGAAFFGMKAPDVPIMPTGLSFESWVGSKPRGFVVNIGEPFTYQQIRNQRGEDLSLKQFHTEVVKRVADLVPPSFKRCYLEAQGQSLQVSQ
ncbi:1-acyl-sn-glycerol-3-phosphate acyltransferase [Candidatus Daviesbacteria bacterium]|nr:1-acyl-sn-glycerol-3-phosphate acyltransferase [Candidatus Daviesbacteria bacterium]